MSKASVGRGSVRQHLTPSPPSRPAPALSRRGFVVKELLLVLAAIVSGVVGLKVIIQLSDEQHEVGLPPQRMLVFQCAVPLGDEFVYLVTVRGYARPGSSSRPFYLSHARFACRNPHPHDAFMLDVIDTGGDQHWQELAICRTWTLMNPAAALADLHERGQIPSGLSELTEDDQLSAVMDRLSWRMKDVTSLEELLWSCVPAPLQEKGIMLLRDERGLKNMHHLQGFPLGRLAAAIRTAARDDRWTTRDPAALLPPNNVGHPELSDDEEQAVAQALVYRLLEFLPQ